MGRPLRVLLVEDSEDDALLLLRELKQGGYDVTSERVDTAAAMESALESRRWDVILSDHRMPSFDAPAALKIAQRKKQDIPFIVVSGAVGENVTVEMMKAGAHDYVMKDNLARLTPAVERELAEARMRRDKARVEEEIAALARFPNENPNPVIRISKDGVVLYANEASEPLLDFWCAKPGKPLGTYWLTMIRQVLLSGTAEETEVEAGDRFFTVKYAPVVESGYVNIYALDITARKHAVEELRRAQSRIAQQERLRALGQMASGIAHDFNNALAPILGFSELALTHPRFLEDKAKMRHYLKTINTAAGDAAEVVRRLREFYRPQESAGPLREVNLESLVDEVVSATAPRWKGEARASGRNVAIETAFGKLPPVPVNESEFRQVLINLVFNALDAMPDGGTISVRTGLENGHAVLEVEDTGVGMSQDTVRRCMEPFFTSKKDRGTGLGLSIAHGVIRRHKGSFEVKSEEGKGTVFTIRLPLRAPDETSRILKDTMTMLRPLHILVVDDESLVREVTEGYLVGDDHTVETAGDGAEGLEKFRSGTFDLVITDMAMPKVGGRELAAAVKEISPEMPVILLTGFGEMAKDLDDEPLPVDFVLGKPVKLDELQKAVAKAVGR
jgi:signal transduction histidine kinase/DNA-binding response OmpR family regulator